MSSVEMRKSVGGKDVVAWEQQRILLTLLSGQTERWHQHPFMPNQNVADHSWYVAVILSFIDPFCSVEDLKTALYHDVAELKYGDLSAVLKRTDSALADSRKNAEVETVHRWTGHMGEPTHAMKIADKLADLWQFAMQTRRGNAEARLGYETHLKWLDDLELTKYPGAVILRNAIEAWLNEGSSLFQDDLS